MTDKIKVREYERSKPKRKSPPKGTLSLKAEKTPKTVSDPQVRASRGVKIIGGGERGRGEITQGVSIVQRKQ